MKELLEQLQQLMPLAAAATPGPWRSEMDYEDNWTPMILSNHGHIATVEDINFGSTRQEDREAYPDQMEDNAAFIAAARNLLTPENLTLLCAALAAPVAGWIAVGERLPEEGQAVLLFNRIRGLHIKKVGFLKKSAVKAGYAWDCGVQFREASSISHWMPLPAAPATMEGSTADV